MNLQRMLLTGPTMTPGSGECRQRGLRLMSARKRADNAASGSDWSYHHCSLFVVKNVAAANEYFVKNAERDRGLALRGVTGLLRTYFQFGDTL